MNADDLRVLVVIPARLHSTRLPEKVLLNDTGMFLVQHVYERAQEIPAEVVIATDDKKVYDAVRTFRGQVVMTSREHASGTDRTAEVARSKKVDLVVNLQADEPELEPSDVETLIEAMAADPEAEMGTLVYPYLTIDDQADPSVVKAVVEGDWAVDFRREPTPNGQRHLGIYAYRAEYLQRFTAMPKSPREQERQLEQMRALDNGTRLRAVPASHCGMGVDTPEDYATFVKRWRAC